MPASKVCKKPGCPAPATQRGACNTHAHQTDRARGTSTQRGLGADYQRARTAALKNATHCATCQQPFTTDNPATGGHIRPRRHGGTTADGIKAECRRCNYGWRKTNS
jgi:hypothetical protein